MTAAARRETIVAAIIGVARDDALSDDERVMQVSGLMAEMRVCQVAEMPVKIWLHHPLLDDVIVHEPRRVAAPHHQMICGND